MSAPGRPCTPGSAAPDHTAEAVLHARDIFGGNLVMAFIGGSRACGRQRDDSDIDAFVLLDHGDPGRETEYAVTLRGLHDADGLSFEHYGEIFPRAALESLISFTESVDRAFPEMSEAPCYRGNCLLSIYRKGRVVLQFLGAPKAHAFDPLGVLPELERRAREHLAVWRTDLPPSSDVVHLAPGTPQQVLLDAWAADEAETAGLNTPVGVDLRRWFGAGLEQREALIADAARPNFGQLTALANFGQLTALECPLAPTPAEQRVVYDAQCLAHLPNDPSTSPIGDS
jgi:hypothetical protein